MFMFLVIKKLTSIILLTNFSTFCKKMCPSIYSKASAVKASPVCNIHKQITNESTMSSCLLSV